MFGNPYYNQQANVDRINQQIQELERMKNNYQNMPQQPMNVINVGNNTQNDFKAQYIDDNTKVEDLLVQCKTAFIDLKNGFLKVKELNGDITTYELVIPKTPEQIENEQLKAKLKEMEMKFNELTNNNANLKKQKSTSNDSELS